MGVLDNFFTGTSPTSNQSSTSQTQMPAWYQDLTRAIGANAAGVASNPYPQFPGQRVAGWTPEHGKALQRINANTGAYDPVISSGINAYNNLPGQVAGTYQAVGQNLTQVPNVVGGDAQAWHDNYQKYMSPFTQQVVDDIGRRGARNLNETLLPSVNNAFIGAGGFGSTRNAEILARTMRDAGDDILGQQSNALQSGFFKSADIFGADANRAQQQQQLQLKGLLDSSSLGLNAAQGWQNVVDASARGMGALSQIGQTLQTNDTNQLIMAGDKQRSADQARLDAQYEDFNNFNNWNWNQLGALSKVLGNLQIPQSTTTTSNTTGTAGTPSGLQSLSALAALFQGMGTTPAPSNQQG